MQRVGGGLLGRLTKLKTHVRNGTLITALTRRARRRLRLLPKSTALYPLDPERVMMRRFERQLPVTEQDTVPVGNYALAADRPLSEHSVVYSFGVGSDVRFDEALALRWGCHVHLFDPTPSSIEFAASHLEDHPLLHFYPVGVWTETSEQRFVVPRSGGSASAVYNRDSTDDASFVAQCTTVADIMKSHGHDFIDVLKMDIEGAALPVLESMLEQEICPGQLVVEFERPTGVVELSDYFLRVEKLCHELIRRGYELSVLSRDKYRYYSLELLFVLRRVES